MKLITSRFVFDGSRLLPDDTAVLMKKNMVIEVGKRRVLSHTYGLSCIDCGYSLLVPGFVNLHTHIELSHLEGSMPAKVGFVEWLKAIMIAKATSRGVDRTAMERAVERMIRSGVRLVCDISNDAVSASVLSEFLPGSILFLERYGLRYSVAREVIRTISNELNLLREKYPSIHVYPTAHAVYSTHPELLGYLATLEPSFPFSMHFLESDQERLFLSGRGELYELLDAMGLIDCEFSYTSPVEYIRQRGILRRGTFFVHMVDASYEEFSAVAESGCGVCFCPGSNLYISGQLPDVCAALRSGVRIGIGTDSLASNLDLNILRELGIIFEHFECVRPQRLFGWATSEGASIIGGELGFKSGSVAYPCYFSVDSYQPLEELLEKGAKNIAPDCINV